MSTTKHLDLVDAIVADHPEVEAVFAEIGGADPDVWIKGGDYPDPESLPANRLLRV
jgi:hypothetical protein